MKKSNKLLLFLCGVMVVYVSLYSVLSLNGRYEPFAVDVQGVMWSSWAPVGFYDSNHPWPNSVAARELKDIKTGGWNSIMIYTFFPLWVIDVRFIHKNQ